MAAFREFGSTKGDTPGATDSAFLHTNASAEGGRDDEGERFAVHYRAFFEGTKVRVQIQEVKRVDSSRKASIEDLDISRDEVMQQAVCHAVVEDWANEKSYRRVLRFRMSDVEPLVRHARSVDKHLPSTSEMFAPQCYDYLREGVSPEDVKGEGPYGLATIDQIDTAKIPAGLVLCRDYGGVYLDDNGDPTLKDDEGNSRIAYALGCNVDEQGEDARAEADRLVGRDAFQNSVPIEWAEEAIRRGRRYFVIGFEDDPSKESFRIEFQPYFG